jgi:hypothetical protein
MMTALRKGLPPLPARIKALPIDPRGYPIPWFVAVSPEGVRDFRFADPNKRAIAVRDRRCWICGDKLGRYLAFVVGPMCVVNRNTSEPPCHRECADFAAHACPFMLLPRAQYRTANSPEDIHSPTGFLDGNPGVMCLYITTTFRTYRAGKHSNDWLITIGDPVECLWYAEGKPASREAVLEAVERRIPLLREMAERDGKDAVAELEKMKNAMLTLLPEPAH